MLSELFPVQVRVATILGVLFAVPTCTVPRQREAFERHVPPCVFQQSLLSECTGFLATQTGVEIVLGPRLLRIDDVAIDYNSAGPSSLGKILGDLLGVLRQQYGIRVRLRVDGGKVIMNLKSRAPTKRTAHTWDEG